LHKLNPFKYLSIKWIYNKNNNLQIVAECDENDLNNFGEEGEDWLKTSTDCPYFDDMATGVVNNKNKRKTYQSNKGGNKRFKRGKSKKYVYMWYQWIYYYILIIYYVIVNKFL